MFSPVKSARSFLESAEVYFCFAERVVRSFAVRPPLLYGGSVMTESTQPSGRPERTARASPWCREKGKEEPLFGCGIAEGNTASHKRPRGPEPGIQKPVAADRGGRGGVKKL
jgi:hypothetical protein